MPIPNPPIIEPPVLQLRGLIVTQEYLRRDYEDILNLLRLHEQELILLWLLFFGTLGVTIYRGRRIEKSLKEFYDNSK